MNLAMLAEMGLLGDDVPSRPDPQDALFDELFQYQRAGAAANHLIRRAESDALQRAICDDDPLPVPSESSARSLDDFLSAAIDEAFKPSDHFEKIKRAAAAAMQRAVEAARDCGCRCSCDQCGDGKCEACQGAESGMKCQNWTTANTESERVCNIDKTICGPTRKLTLKSARALFAKGIKLVKYRTAGGETVELVQV